MRLEDARIPEDRRIYAIGDIHGCLQQLEALLGKVKLDLGQNPVGDHKLVLLGDYVDRGPHSKSLLDYLIDLQDSETACEMLLGNHDERLASFVRDPKIIGEAFLMWGGVQTLESYGVPVAPGDDIYQLHERLLEVFPDNHLKFLDELKLFHIEADYMFVHAGVRPGVGLDRQRREDLLWIRDDFLLHDNPFEKIVVHGHTPVNEPEFRANRINADTGCVYGGALTAIVIERESRRIIQV